MHSAVDVAVGVGESAKVLGDSQWPRLAGVAHLLGEGARQGERHGAGQGEREAEVEDTKRSGNEACRTRTWRCGLGRRPRAVARRDDATDGDKVPEPPDPSPSPSPRPVGERERECGDGGAKGAAAASTGKVCMRLSNASDCTGEREVKIMHSVGR